MTEQQQRTYKVYLDPITGFYDRRTLWSRLAEEVARARRYRYHLSLMLISIDLCDPAEVEEQVLQLSGLLKQSTRAVDILVRYSKDALALLLPCTDETGAVELAQRIQHMIRNVAEPASDRSDPLPVSIGVTSSPGEDWGNKIALVEQVEAALRQARREGGNHVVVVPVKGGVPE
ncbi:MAG: diguanylate cyclase [Chloroflexia bacterium]|nr:diguanylate cyclase [Chloroflexia bacterium]